MWDWYEWDTLADFNAWHEIIKDQLGLPRLSMNKYGEACEPIIENYTDSIHINGKVIAMVEVEYSSELTQTQLRPITELPDFIEA